MAEDILTIAGKLFRSRLIVGTASDAAIAMELGVDGVVMNTGIAGAADPVMMAEAMRKAVEAGRLAFLSGRIPRRMYATASSPVEGVIGR